MVRKRILGAVIAGGRSRRFGSGKALAVIDGQPMIAHVVDALWPQVDELVICGREWWELRFLPDLRPDKCGPLAGMEAALRHAQDRGYEGVITVPVDNFPLPIDLVARLVGKGPAIFEHQTLIGYWPVSYLAALEDQLSLGLFSVGAWLVRSSAHRVREPFAIANINRSGDLPAAVERKSTATAP